MIVYALIYNCYYIDMADTFPVIFPVRRYHTLIIQTSLSNFLTQLMSSELARNQFIQAIIDTGFDNCQIDFPLISGSELANISITKIEICITEIIDNPDIVDWSIFDHMLSRIAKRNQINNMQSKYGLDYMIDQNDIPEIDFDTIDYDYVYDQSKDLTIQNTIYFKSKTHDTYICTVIPSLNYLIDNNRITLMRFFKSADYMIKHQLIICLIKLVEHIIRSNPLEKVFISSGSDVDWINFKVADTPINYMHPKFISYYSHYNRPVTLFI